MSFPFDFDLPPERIAQQPCAPRDRARLLVVPREGAPFQHRHVFDLPDLLRPGDLLVFNDTRVVPARLLGKRRGTGGAWEGLFLKSLPDGSWEMLCQTRGKLKEGEWVDVDGLHLELVERLPEGRWRARPEAAADWPTLLDRYGRVPLPPYIRKGVAAAEDRERYQTTYAREPGAVAAPTAGLHFTPELLARLEEKGVGQAFVTLHVGLGTFRPIEAVDYRQHAMHAEWGRLPEETVLAIRRTREVGGRVVGVGTTSVRVLETAGREGELHPWSGETALFIYPPFSFRVVDLLMTNFHLPRSTLLLLVCAFAGTERMRAAYAEALAGGYRFFSYGDAMLLERDQDNT
ncbi:MAG: tRNA preQ1(34) S-adenosylmethionine ribosyltransferase-isomerase QueA [Gemmataceae bacterium]